jgi:transcriptional regulator with XRE-family HTH domain
VFYDRLLALCQENNKKMTPVIIELGLSAGSMARWKNGTVPDGNTICKIADYFDVSADYLLEKTDIKKAPSILDGEENEKNEIAKIFSDLLPEQQEQAKKYLRYLLDTQEKTSQDNL